jgi:hypothetical protein
MTQIGLPPPQKMGEKMHNPLVFASFPYLLHHLLYTNHVVFVCLMLSSEII